MISLRHIRRALRTGQYDLLCDPWRMHFSPLMGVVAGGGKTAASYYDTIIADAPVSYWRLGDTSGTSAVDARGVSNGSYSGTSYSLNQTGAVTGGKSVSFAASGHDHVLVASNAGYNVTSGSVEAWFKTSTTGVAQTIIRRDTIGTGRMFLLQVGTDNKIAFQVIYGGNPTIKSTSTYADGNWHYVCATWAQNGTNTDLKLYVDSASVVTGSATATSPSATVQVCIATARADGFTDTSEFTGYLAELAYYGSALSGTRVAAHYAAK